jgi:hypothetical protein
VILRKLRALPSAYRCLSRHQVEKEFGMKHMVQIRVTPQASQDIESRPGGPAPCISRLVERFKPETVYMSPAQRALFMVCELNAADMAELMIAGCRFAGQHPEFIPVIDGKDFGGLVAKALPAAKKLVDG